MNFEAQIIVLYPSTTLPEPSILTETKQPISKDTFPNTTMRYNFEKKSKIIYIMVNVQSCPKD